MVGFEKKPSPPSLKGKVKLKWLKKETKKAETMILVS